MRFDNAGHPIPVYICKPGEKPYPIKGAKS